MASDAARRFLLSVPLEPQLLLQAEGVSLRRERRHLLLLPLVSLGSGRGGKLGTATRSGGGPAASQPLATPGRLETWGGNLGPSQPGPALTSASGHRLSPSQSPPQPTSALSRAP